MALPTIFEPTVNTRLLNRLEKLQATKQAVWGKMSAGQMLAHLNVMFELALENKHKRPGAPVRFLLKTLVKPKIVNEKPYARNSRTAPEMVIRHEPDFTTEKQRLNDYLQLLLTLGAQGFDQREHPSFGAMSTTEWNNTLYKHIDHHFTQFGI